MKVIIADDSGTIRRIVCGMLNSLGYDDCLTADGGDQVLRLLEENTDVGLVLLDWNMPVMNGLECLRAIRENQATSAVPVVMVTSEATRARVLEASKAGASNYLVKPFDIDRFKTVVAPFLR